MGLGIVYGTAWQAWHGIWYCLGARNGVLYGLLGTACYLVWPGSHGMVYVMAWQASYDGMA